MLPNEFPNEATESESSCRTRRASHEYDAYIGQIYRLLVSNPNKAQVAAVLRELEEGAFGMGPAKEEALLPVAEKLLAIDVRLNR